MIETTILVQPLLGSLLVARVDHGAVDELQVLGLALRLDELVRLFENRRVILKDAEPVPSLLHFGVQGVGEMVVVVDSLHDRRVDLTPVFSQFVEEDELVLGIVVFERLELVWRAGAFQVLVLLGESLRLLRVRRREVNVNGQMARSVDPAVPVKLVRDLLELIGLTLECLFLEEYFEGVDEISRGGGSLVESSHIVAQELSHVLLADEGLKVIEQLGSLVVLNV